MNNTNGSECGLPTRFTGSASKIGVNTSLSRESCIAVPARQSSSVFGGTACGQPLSTQHLVLDFTPKEDVDNEFVQRKCCSFWDYVNSRKDLRHFIVLAERNVCTNTSTRISTAEDELQTATPIRADRGQAKDRTAVSMLDIVEKRGQIDRTFATQLPQSLCSMGSKEYNHGRNGFANKQTIRHIKEVSNCSSGCKSAKIVKNSPESKSEVKVMCRHLQEWDLSNPNY